jgi:diguanylate cyclase (GGDEF)-like protein
MEIRLYFQMLQRGWWLILLTTLVAITTSLTASYLAVPQYRATARFIITPNAFLTTGQEVISGLNSLNNRTLVTTFAEVMNSERIINDALLSLGLDASVMEHYTYLAVVLPDTTVLEINVTGPNTEVATRLANAIGSVTISYMQRVNKIYDLNFLDIAVVPTIPVSPQPLRDLGLALALGLVGGSILAVLSEQIRIPLETYRQRLRLDKVTSVYTRQFFMQLLDDELAENANQVLSVGILEMNNFKDFSSALPVASTEKILQIVTGILRKEFRGNDTIGRWNESSFIIMLPNTSGESAKKIFERVYNVLSSPSILNQLGSDLDLDSHIGGAEYSSDISAKELIEQTENALEFARRDNLNPVYVWAMKNPFWVREKNAKK